MQSLLFLVLFLFSSAEAKTIVVKIEATKFIPEQIEAQVGDTITWDNKDFFPHTATALDKSFDSHSILSGKTWSLQVKKTGTFKYKCLFHTVMSGTLKVH